MKTTLNIIYKIPLIGGGGGVAGSQPTEYIFLLEMKQG
jgi:hypothetical protein